MRPFGRASLLSAALTSAIEAFACTATDTSTALTGPSPSKCQFNVAGSPSTFPAAGGKGELTIDTTRECSWTAGTNASWISLGKTTGQGGAAFSYSVAENSVPSARSAAITVAGMAVQLSQSAAPCRYSLSRHTDRIGHEGGHLAVSVETLTGCEWTASTDVEWLTIVAGVHGNASATVELFAEPNAGVERVGHLSVAGEVDEIVQDNPPPAPAPPSPPPPTPGPPSPPPPSPGPPPPPPAPPPGGQQAHLNGRIESVSGSCPNVTFIVDDTTVAADGSTNYRKGRCRDLDEGADVSVDGLVQGDGSVLAKEIRVDKKA